MQHAQLHIPDQMQWSLGPLGECEKVLGLHTHNEVGTVVSCPVPPAHGIGPPAGCVSNLQHVFCASWRAPHDRLKHLGCTGGRRAMPRCTAECRQQQGSARQALLPLLLLLLLLLLLPCIDWHLQAQSDSEASLTAHCQVLAGAAAAGRAVQAPPPPAASVLSPGTLRPPALGSRRQHGCRNSSMW